MTRRLLISYLALTLVVLAALEIPLAVNEQRRLEADLTSRLQRDAFAIAAFAEETVEGTGRANLQTLADTYAAKTQARVVIVDKNGDSMADSNPTTANENFLRAGSPEFADALGGAVSTGTRHSDTLDTDLLYVTVPIASGNVYGAVRLTYSTDQIQERLHHYWLVLAGIAAVSLVAAAAVGIALARWVARPLEQVRTAATDFGHGDLAARAPTEAGPPEVRELAEAFNATAARLEHLVSAQEQFVADASHQLRTPLTALRLRIENLQEENLVQQSALAEHGATNPRMAQDLEASLAETRRLSRLVDGLLALARADRADPAAGAEVVDVDQVIDERASVWEPVASERGVRLSVEPAGFRIRATPDRLTQILDNLLANALEASPAGSTITLSSELAGPGTAADRPTGADHGDRGDPLGRSPAVAIHITDQGPGMTEHQRDRAFDRFWRAPTAATAPVGSSPVPAGAAAPDVLGGSGLGLSIVRQLARADGGDVELHAAAGGGLDAVVHLPHLP